MRDVQMINQHMQEMQEHMAVLQQQAAAADANRQQDVAEAQQLQQHVVAVADRLTALQQDVRHDQDHVVQVAADLQVSSSRHRCRIPFSTPFLLFQQPVQHIYVWCCESFCRYQSTVS